MKYIDITSYENRGRFVNIVCGYDVPDVHDHDLSGGALRSLWRVTSKLE